MAENDTFVQMAARVKETGSDNFRVRVRRRSSGGLLVPGASPNDAMIVTIENVSSAQLATPETWIGALCGNSGMRDDSLFLIEVWHPASKNDLPVGLPIIVKLKGPETTVIDRAMIDRVLADSDYTGPRDVIFPPPQKKQAQLAAPFVNAQGSTPPPAQTTLDTLAKPPETGDKDVDYRVRLERQMAERAAKLEKEMATREQALRESSLKGELDAIRAETTRALAEVKSLLQSAPVVKGPSLLDQLTPLLTIVMPIVGEIIKSNKATQEAIEKARIEASKEAAASQHTLVQALLTRPPEGGGATAALIQTMSSMAVSQVQANMNMFQQVRDMMLPPPDETTWWQRTLETIAPNVGKALEKFAEPSPVYVQPGATRLAQTQQPQPPQIPAAPGAPAPQEAPAPSAPTPVTVQQRYGFRSPFDTIEAFIRQGQRPPAQIAEMIVRIIENPDDGALRELKEANNDLMAIVKARIGDLAASQDQNVLAYLESLLRALQPKLARVQQGVPPGASAAPAPAPAPAPSNVTPLKNGLREIPVQQAANGGAAPAGDDEGEEEEEDEEEEGFDPAEPRN